MDKINPIILNAKVAEDHLGMIKAQHTEILNGLNQQSLRSQAYNQQKDMEKKEQMVTDTENAKQFREQQDKNQRESADRDLKIKELEIKRQALTMP